MTVERAVLKVCVENLESDWSKRSKRATRIKRIKRIIWSPGNSNAHLLFGHTNGTVDSTGQKIRKTSGGGNNWNTQIISNVSYANGCYVSFRPSGYPTMMLGLNSKSDLGSLSYSTIDFCFYVHENKSLSIYENGKGRAIGTYSPSDVLTITYDNYTIRYLQNGQVKRSVTVGAGKTYHLDSSLHMHGKTDWATSMIAFGPMGAVGTRGATGAGCEGSKGCTLELVKKVQPEQVVYLVVVLYHHQLK